MKPNNNKNKKLNKMLSSIELKNNKEKKFLKKANLLKEIVSSYEKSKKKINKINRFKNTNNIKTIQNKNNKKLFGMQNHKYSQNIIEKLNSRYNQTLNELKQSKKVKEIIQKEDSTKILTPIPKIKYNRKNNNKKVRKLSSEVVQRAIVIRRYEYNGYLYKKNEINKLKRKYPSHKIVKIQKHFKGFRVREINKNVENLIFHECSVEIFLLMALSNIIKALKRKTFNILKNINYIQIKKEKSFLIDNEMNFEDKIKLKLPYTYYYILIKQNNLKSDKFNK